MLLKNRYIRKNYQSLLFFTKRHIKLLLLIILIFFSSLRPVAISKITDWKILEPGLKYKVFKIQEINPFSKIHVLDINLKRINIRFCQTKKPITTKDAILKSGALAAINGAFFDSNYQSLGLRISNGTITSQHKKISWWRTFFIKDNQASIKKLHILTKSNQMSFGLQSGPKLIINNKIPKLKNAYTNRTAMGIKKDKHVIMLITENSFMTTTEIALFMKHTLKCSDAINLDGGGSSQMSIKSTDFSYQVSGLTKLSDPICLFKNK